ncbi:MAG: PilZ domain-containing protein [Oscillospiraceae bacterium]|nr:PilZ domain-containing protein [Oscillospiraceae bacterium]
MMKPQFLVGMNVHLMGPDNGMVFASGSLEQAGKDEIMIQLTMGDEVDLHGNIMIGLEDSVNGLHIFNGVILSYDRPIIQVAKLKYIETRQRREDVRVNLAPGTIVRVRFADFIDGDIPKISADVTLGNISVGGMMFECEDDIDTEMGISMTLKLKEGSVNLPEITILRKNFDKTRKLYTYGCKFNYIPRADADNLRNFIFAQQLRHRKKDE